MKIEYDEQSSVIRVGKAEFTQFTNFDNALSFAHHIFSVNGVSLRELDQPYVLCKADSEWGEARKKYLFSHKERYKAIGDKLGCSLSVFHKNFQALQRKAFIVPVYDIYQKLSDHYPRRKFKGNKWNTDLLNRIYEVKDKLLPVHQDGLNNLLPLVYKLNRTPQELRKELKSGWKVLAKNSLNKNKKLIRCVRNGALDFTHDDENYRAEMVEKTISQLTLNLPTSLIQYQYLGYSHEALKYAEYNLRGKWNDKKFMYDELRMFQDTMRMSEQLGEKVNPKWTPRRMKEEHDRMSKEITARKYSKDKFESTKNIPVKSLKLGDYTATLLESAFDIADEGDSMGHCVAGYADSVRTSNYLVYSVTKDGKRSSTVGITNYVKHESYKGPKYSLQQQYGKYNASVKDMDEQKLGQMIVEELNKALDNPEKQA